MKVLVTGGTGYVAGWTIRLLLEQGHQVRTTVRSLARAEKVHALFPGAEVEVVAADLTEDEGWAEAVADIDAVLHVASPLGSGTESETELVTAAVDGTKRVLRAATAAGVRRVVMTSSGAAATPPPGAEGEFDESLWTDPDQADLDGYRRSKALAERAAWAYVEEHAGATELTTILPGAVFGPLLTPDTLGSVGVVARLMSGAMRGVPRIGLRIVDVRDLADAHVRAMTAPEAAGRRFLAVGDLLTMHEVAAILREHYPAEAARAPRRELPDWAVRLAARFRPELRNLVPMLGRRYSYSTAAARDVLGWKARPAEETIVDTGRSLVDLGLV